MYLFNIIFLFRFLLDSFKIGKVYIILKYKHAILNLLRFIVKYEKSIHILSYETKLIKLMLKPILENAYEMLSSLAQ